MGGKGWCVAVLAKVIGVSIAAMGVAMAQTGESKAAKRLDAGRAQPLLLLDFLRGIA